MLEWEEEEEVGRRKRGGEGEAYSATFIGKRIAFLLSEENTL